MFLSMQKRTVVSGRGAKLTAACDEEDEEEGCDEEERVDNS